MTDDVIDVFPLAPQSPPPAPPPLPEHSVHKVSADFDAECVTKKRYSTFLNNLRRQLSDESKVLPNLEVLVLPNRSSFTQNSQEDNRMLIVRLSNTSETDVLLVLDRVDAYIVGYIVENRFYHLTLEDHQQFFCSYAKRKSMTVVALDLGSDYGDLQSVAKPRAGIELGILKLQKAITTLKDTDISTAGYKNSVAEALLVCIQMVSEAARFSYIEDKVCETINEKGVEYGSFKPDVTMMKLENNWRKVSTAVLTKNFKLVEKEFDESDGDYSQYLKLAKFEDNVGNESGTSRKRRNSNSGGLSGMPPQLGKNTKGMNKVKDSSKKQKKF